LISRKLRPAPHSHTSQPKSGMKSPEQGFAYALRLLGDRDYSLEGLRRKLLGKGVGAPEAEGILRRLESLGLLDDERYARRLASYCTNEKLWGPRRVLQKLLEKGIPAELARALAEAAAQEGSSRERLRKVLGSKLKGQGMEGISPREKKRLANLLFRRGFPWDDIMEVLREGGGFTEE
jgi:regulatory protein